MCTGRVDLAFILRAFSNGNDGVFIGGCWLGECHYITEGNYDALSLMHLCRKLLEHIGVNPARLRLEWISASEGIRFAEVMNDFSKELKKLGPLGSEDGLDENQLKTKLAAATRLIPYLKLVEREKLRVRFKTEAEYDRFFSSDRVNRLFQTLIVDKLAVSQIMLLLQQSPRSTAEISEMLGLEPSQTAKHLNLSARQGLVRYDEDLKRYAHA